MQSLAEYFRKPTPEEERLLRGEALDMSLYQPAPAAAFSGKSLLPVGVKAVIGDFLRGEIIQVVDQNDKEICRGMINYGSDESRRIMGLHSDEVVEELGYLEQRELIHQDNMVVMNK